MKSAKTTSAKKGVKSSQSTVAPKALSKKQAVATQKNVSTFNVHLVVPENSGIDTKNIRFTVKGAQLVIEVLTEGEEVTNQVQGVKKIPTPPRPKLPLPDLFGENVLKFTLSKKRVR